jgi:hypothetical protein
VEGGNRSGFVFWCVNPLANIPQPSGFLLYASENSDGALCGVSVSVVVLWAHFGGDKSTIPTSTEYISL